MLGKGLEMIQEILKVEEVNGGENINPQWSFTLFTCRLKKQEPLSKKRNYILAPSSYVQALS